MKVSNMVADNRGVCCHRLQLLALEMPSAEDGDLWAQSATKVQHLHYAGVLKLGD